MLAHYDRLRDESREFVDWVLVADEGHLDAVSGEVPHLHPSIVMRRRFAAARAIGRLTDGAGMMDIAFMPRILAAPHDRVWVLEFDVDYSGNWSDFFRRFARNRADLLTTTLTPRARNAGWTHWSTARAPGAVGAASWLRSFNPILRASRDFARSYIAAIEAGGWEGHNEFTIPTIARHLGFRVADIGGPFRRVLPRASRVYCNTPADPTLSPGTFVWRPARPAYFHERPDSFPERNRLYHPVKPP